MAKSVNRPRIDHARFGGELGGVNSLLNSIREQIQIDQGERGDPLERSVKVKDLADAGIAQYTLSKSSNGFYASLSSLTSEQLITSAPPNPSGLEVNATTASIYLTWDTPNYPYHAYTEIWRSSEDNLSTAVDLGARPEYRYYSDPVDSGRTYYYWIRFVTYAGKKSEFNEVGGVSGTSNLSPEVVLETLSNKITSSQLVQSLRENIELIPTVNANIEIASGLLEEAQNKVDSFKLQQSIENLVGIDTRDLKILNRLSNEEMARIQQYYELTSVYKTLNSSTRAEITILEEVISTESEARVTLSESIETQFDNLESDISTRATKTELSQAISTESEARVTSVTQLSTTINDQTATLQEQSESIDGLRANWAVKFQIGSDGIQRVSGFGISADGDSTAAHFDVDEFSISKPGATALDFAVADVEQPDGTTRRMVVMDAASIVNLVVTEAMIESVSADKITSGKVNAEFIDTENLTVKSAQSSSFISGISGWRLDKTGLFEINSSTDDGRIIQNGEGIKVYDASGTLRVKMGKL